MKMAETPKSKEEFLKLRLEIDILLLLTVYWPKQITKLYPNQEKKYFTSSLKHTSKYMA
jgi:hypothetical protein